MNEDSSALDRAPAVTAEFQAGDAVSPRCYLLVFDGGSSTIFHVPPNSSVAIGRGEDAKLRLPSESVSRLHARLSNHDDEVRIADLGSRNGTLVNGERVVGSRALASGDVISIGAITLVLNRSARVPTRRAMVSLSVLRQRLEEEIERAIRYERPVTMLAIDISFDPAERTRLAQAVSSKLRLIDVACWDGEAHLLVLLPEVGAETVSAVSGRLMTALDAIARGSRGGYATCPTDGCDADTLLASARAAAKRAEPGIVAPASSAATVLSIGQRQVVIADPALIRLFALLQRLAPSDISVLISGETGVGKEIAAAALHHWSPRKDRPLVTINCAAIQETLVESELFGYEKGAFSGAGAAKPGLFETADGGMVFLDEIGELSPTAQAKLLRVIETKRVCRIGSVRDIEVDVRFIAATNRSLEDEVKNGRFREDLYYRLSGATVILPALRDRPSDLPILARTFLGEACNRLDRDELSISPGAMQKLLTYRWPGNVRELRNLMDFVAATVHEPVLEPWLLPARISGEAPIGVPSLIPVADLELEAPTGSLPALTPGGDGKFRNIYEEIEDLERTRLKGALDATGGVQVRAAELIGMPLRTFAAKIKRYKITRAPAAGRRDP